MEHSLTNEATLAVVLGRFNSHRLPRILALKKMLDRGEPLGEFDLHFLERVVRDVNHYYRLANGSPRHQAVLAQTISLYREVIAKALENERQAERP